MRARAISRYPICLAAILAFCTFAVFAQTRAWRVATEAELHTVIPARAPAIAERIETEFRTASGITDGKGHFVAGVVMITAGYSAEGKYSHYFLTQVPLRVGSVALAPGDYLFGWKRIVTPDASGAAVQPKSALLVSFYNAGTGAPVGEVQALRDATSTRVESFRIWPPNDKSPNDKSMIQIGRFIIPYSFPGR